MPSKMDNVVREIKSNLEEHGFYSIQMNKKQGMVIITAYAGASQKYECYVSQLPDIIEVYQWMNGKGGYIINIGDSYEPEYIGHDMEVMFRLWGASPPLTPLNA